MSMSKASFKSSPRLEDLSVNIVLECDLVNKTMTGCFSLVNLQDAEFWPPTD